MSPLRHTLCTLACLALLPVGSRADAPADPLRLVPEQADLFLKVEQPRQLLETFTTLDLFKQLQTLDAVKELYDSTNYRRFLQLVAHFEKQLGTQWPDALDRLAGGGVLAVQFGPDPAPALVVIQGKDEALLKKFAPLILQVIEQELARQESKDKLEKGEYRKIETYRIGKDFHAAVAGSAILLSNKDQVLEAALDRHLDGGKKSLANVAAVAEGHKLLGGAPLAWAWLNLESARKQEGAKDVFAKPNDNAVLTVLFGGLLDVAGRAPFLCAGFYHDKDTFRLSFRMPRGREGLPAEMVLHVPPTGEAGSRPLLEPKDVVFSTSFYLDAAKLWEHRAKLLNAQPAKDLEAFDENSGRYLAGSKLSGLLKQAAPYHRFVVAHQAKRGYKTAPKLQLPAFAYVLEMRDPDDFSRSVESILRATALLGAFSEFKLRLVEEKHGDLEIVGYRFPENVKVKDDVNDLRFNFSPCFVRVGNQFVASSTLELCHELIDLLEKEAKDKPKSSPAANRARMYAEGGVEALKAFEDQLVTQAILGQAVPADEARQQVKTLLGLVRQLGVLHIETHYGEKDFRYDFRLKMGK